MLARPYQSADAEMLDKLLGFNRAGDVRLDHDKIFVVGDVGSPEGVLVYRPGAFLHELECGTGPMRRLRADALVNYAIAYAKSQGLRSAVFKVASSNLPMRRWVEQIGGIEQEGQVLYQLTPL